jgi:hypothetical protein
MVIAGDLNVVEPDHVPFHRVFGQWEYDFYQSFAKSGLTDAFRHLNPRRVEHSWVRPQARIRLSFRPHLYQSTRCSRVLQIRTGVASAGTKRSCSNGGHTEVRATNLLKPSDTKHNPHRGHVAATTEPMLHTSCDITHRGPGSLRNTSPLVSKRTCVWLIMCRVSSSISRGGLSPRHRRFITT